VFFVTFSFPFEIRHSASRMAPSVGCERSKTEIYLFISLIVRRVFHYIHFPDCNLPLIHWVGTLGSGIAAATRQPPRSTKLFLIGLPPAYSENYTPC
jgi:hypothetical protein